MPLLSANTLVCETVLWEKTDVPTLVRVMSALALGPGNNFAHFFVVTFLSCQPGDSLSHTLRVQITNPNGQPIAEAQPFPFNYGYKVDPNGPGAFILATEFNIDVTRTGLPVNGLVSAFLDDQSVTCVPLMLRRA